MINNTTPLFLATTIANLSLMKLLIDCGANVNDKPFKEQTALHIACKLQMIGKISLLLKHGADPNVLDDNGRTPFSYLIEDQKSIFTCVEIMLKKLATLAFQGIIIHDSRIIKQYPLFQKFFLNCLMELKLMNKMYFYKSLTLYDVFTVSKILFKS